MNKLKLSFLMREFFAGDRTKTTIRGYEPAVMSVGGELKVGRIIDLDELAKADYVDFLLFQTEVDLEKSEIDLEERLKQDKGGKAWLESHQKYFSEYFGEAIPLVFRIKRVLPPGVMEYIVFPKDYFERTKEGPIGCGYKCPEAILRRIPDSLHYWRIEPPMKFKDGKWIKGANYERVVSGPKGVFDSYSLRDPNDDQHHYTEGILFGSLDFGDLEDVRGDFEGDIPLTHSFKMVYLAPMNRLQEFSPMTIKVELS